jgi:hypothetical protein
VFTGDTRARDAASATESPGTLFANELGTDVGGTCWGSNEPLPVIDHHFSRDSQFPSASAAVLHKAKLIREHFAQQDGAIWLVTHKQPDFDAFCSMYLARWTIVASEAALDLERYGLHRDGWLDLPEHQRIDWLNPDLSRVAIEHRWPMLLAGFASVLDQRHRISCPRQRTLDSILEAAIKRGRNYLSETSGATEFFDEVRRCLLEAELNPIFDSVMAGSTGFAPELALLDGEAEAYERDLRRARRAIVYLPQSEAPSPKFFKTPLEVAALQEQGMSQEVDAERLLLADTFRIPTSGIYVRDPECLLFQEWARLDLENSPLEAGFDFTATASSTGRPAAAINQTDYAFAIDPERANGRHLYTLWSRLQTREVEALQTPDRRSTEAEGIAPRRAFEPRTAPLEVLLLDPWFGGQNTFGILVGTPQRGTAIGPPGERSDLRDDPVVEEVRTELENLVYSAESLVAGPQLTIVDCACLKNLQPNISRSCDLNLPLKIPSPHEKYFRFATVGLRADTPIFSTGNLATLSAGSLARQIGETLWQVLYPETPGAMPPDFVEHHLVVLADSVGVWSDRGVVIAQKHLSSADKSSPTHEAATVGDEFANIISLLRDVEQFAADAQSLSDFAACDTDGTSAPSAVGDPLAMIVSRGEELARRALQVEHSLTLPDRELLRRFSAAIGNDRLLATLRDLNHAAAERLRCRRRAEQNERAETRATMLAKLGRTLAWLEVLLTALLATGIIDVITWTTNLGSVKLPLLLMGGPVILGLMAAGVKPWKLKPTTIEGGLQLPSWVLFVATLACISTWLLGLLPIWSR